MTTPDEMKFASAAHKVHFKRMVHRCAKNGKWMILALPPRNKHGDFLFAEYVWSREETESWMKDRVVPVLFEDFELSANILTTVFIKPAIAFAQPTQIRITREMFMRIEEVYSESMLMLYAGPGRVFICQKKGLVFTEEQKQGYRDGSISHEVAPTFGECMSSGTGVQMIG
ncbi:hypothetical protein NA57DRAFT_53860 [Rhizodiscina lignyota]|uniref:Uncharacterized protein n=1 Tax=Rhizodiscina lignyota TaxID=1504668 RepID=A0A9P4IHS6_9PEZI|nr:hypothetical protein NA57DRAFT_53860 [Rhizodiscina lignyota]